MRRLLYILGAVVVVWTVLSAVTLVQPGERAVVRRFGRVLEYKPEPGLFIGLPWGFDRVDRVPVGQVRRVVVGLAEKITEDERGTPAGQVLTGDHNLVNVQAEVYFVVVEDQVASFALQMDRADSLVGRLSEAALAEWVAGRTVDDVLRVGKGLLPAFLVRQVQARINDYGLGVRIEQASIVRLDPPDEVKDAFDVADQAKAGIQTQVYQAQQQANRKQRDAEAERFRIERLTAAYADEQKLQASAEAEAFLRRLEEYRKLVAKDPNYLNTLWQDEMTRLYARMREAGRIDVLDHFLSSEGLNITQFPLLQKKK